MDTPPRASIIIPVRDDSARLQTCLEALDRQSLAGALEILVVDNGSSDDPEAVVRGFPRARLLHEAEPSSYAARNLGVREASGAIFAFTDSDCIPASDWIERGVAAIEQAEA